MATPTPDADCEPTTSPQEWEQFYEQLFDTPEDRAEAERDFHEMIAFRTIVRQREAERKRGARS